jgi:hypothetical protein
MSRRGEKRHEEEKYIKIAQRRRVRGDGQRKDRSYTEDTEGTETRDDEDEERSFVGQADRSSRKRRGTDGKKRHRPVLLRMTA